MTKKKKKPNLYEPSIRSIKTQLHMVIMLARNPSMINFTHAPSSQEEKTKQDKRTKKKKKKKKRNPTKLDQNNNDPPGLFQLSLVR